MKTVHIIDDETELVEILIELISMLGYNAIAYKSWDSLNISEISENDVVLADLTGTGVPKNVPCKVYSMSGDGTLSPDFEKPFDFNRLTAILVA